MQDITDYFNIPQELIKYYYSDNILLKNKLQISSYNTKLIRDKITYHKDSCIANTISYEYNKEEYLCTICKKLLNKEFLIKYEYDIFNRITEKSINFNGKQIAKQKYRYDVLDRVVEYEDNYKKILVNKISKKNELISYTITDRIGNVISVENHFADCGYICTTLIVNGHSTSVNNSNYMDNVMLKKPYASEEDLDIIISNLFTSMETVTQRTIDTNNAMKLIDANIKNRTLPISLRKRALYNTVVKRA